MSDTKFTPGPWTIMPAVEYDGDDDEFQGAYTSPASIEGADGNPVCVFGTCEGSGFLYENEADYHLIAASPDMFAAGSRVLDYATLDTILADPKRHDNEVFGIRLGDLRPLAAALSKASGKEA